MTQQSDLILNRKLANPFRDTQARNFTADKLTDEFFLTSAFLSLFNSQHEILLGTRGSGRTALLRMMSYSHLRTIRTEQVRPYIDSLAFIGFYIPMHLELMAPVIGGTDKSPKLEYFQFAVNCQAAVSFLYELDAVMCDRYPDPRQRFPIERNVVSHLVNTWAAGTDGPITTMSDLRWYVADMFASTTPWADGTVTNLPPLSSNVLVPILNALPKVNTLLGLSNDHATWVACVDDAEVVGIPYMRCLNTFMRTEKRDLVLKMATLHHRHSTLETTVDGVVVEPDGHDFVYRVIDMGEHSSEFRRFTDHLSRIRLKDICACDRLEDFLGTIGRERLIDYYAREFGDTEAKAERLLGKLIPLLSNAQQARYATLTSLPLRIRYEFLLKFSPLLYVREMRSKQRKTNNTVGWFAGARVVRKVSDGNPRRFLQLMTDLFDAASTKKLTPEHQQSVISQYARRTLDMSEGIPGVGPVVRTIIEAVGEKLRDRIHGTPMVESGCAFTLSGELSDNDDIGEAVRAAMVALHVVPISAQVTGTLGRTTFRLSYVHAVNYWLPMRKGVPFQLSRRSFREIQRAEPSMTGDHAAQLTLFTEDD